jgi:AcrR family transcriptional regulator
MNIVHAGDITIMNDVQEAGARRDSADARRADQREQLVACATRLIVSGGLAALKARDLARELGCAVGAIYNLVDDMDDLILRVASGTSRDLDACLEEAARSVPLGEGRDGQAEAFIAWAKAYLHFARDNHARWRALFEFRLPPGKALPQWFVDEQDRLFARLEDRLGSLLPQLSGEERRLRARVLFSAVHGIVSIALEEKIGAMPLPMVEHELAFFLRTYLSGLQAKQATRS